MLAYNVTEINFEETFLYNICLMMRNDQYNVETGGLHSKKFGEDPHNFDVTLFMEGCKTLYTIQIGVRNESHLSIFITYKGGKYNNDIGFFLLHIGDKNVQKPIGRFKQINAFLRDVLGAHIVEQYGNHLCYQSFILSVLEYVFTYSVYKFTVCFKSMRRTYDRELYQLSKHASDDMKNCGKKHHYLEGFSFNLVYPEPSTRCLAFNTVDDLVKALENGLRI